MLVLFIKYSFLTYKQLDDNAEINNGRLDEHFSFTFSKRFDIFILVHCSLFFIFNIIHRKQIQVFDQLFLIYLEIFIDNYHYQKVFS